MKPAALLGFILLALPFVAHADEDLVAKRIACRQEARVRIMPLGKIGVDEYRSIVERRNTYVSQCMMRAATARKETPLPPRREVKEIADVQQDTAIAPAEKKSRRTVQRAERRKLKVASLKKSKGKKVKTKGLKRLARGRK